MAQTDRQTKPIALPLAHARGVIMQPGCGQEEPGSIVRELPASKKPILSRRGAESSCMCIDSILSGFGRGLGEAWGLLAGPINVVYLRGACPVTFDLNHAPLSSPS